MLWKYTLLWLGLAALGVLNGTLRNYLYTDLLRELRAHQASTVTLVILIGVYVWVFNLFWRIPSPGQALLIGLIWLVLTIAFEFGFGHYVVGHPWEKLLHDYNLFEGRIWILVPLWTLLAPLTVHALKH